MDKLRVAMLFVMSLNNVFNGSKGYDDKLSFYLSNKNDVDLHVITISNEYKVFKKDNMVVHVIKDKKSLFSKILYSPILIWKVRNELIKIDPDVVNVISTTLCYGIAASILRKKYPTLLTAYGIARKEIKYYKQEYKYFYKHIIAIFRIMHERYIISKIPNLIVDSPSIKNLISKWTKSRIYVVPAGIEYDKVKTIDSKSLKLDKLPDIFFVNNLEMLKGTDILIKSLALVKKSIPNISVYIAGVGPQENELKYLVHNLNLEKNVRFLGFISNKEKYQYYKSCKIVVVPSRWDCQPAAIFDASACGKPVIVSDMSNPGIITDGKNGMIFKSENIDELSFKILALLKNEKMQEEMGIRAEDNIKPYDWNRVADRYIEIYNEIINEFN